MPVGIVGELLVGMFRQEATLQERVGRLFEETRDDVYRYLLLLGLEPPRAQEAAQEVFLKLYTTLKKGEVIENPRGWIFRVAHNHGLKIREREEGEERMSPVMEMKLASSTQDPEKALLERERMAKFHDAIASLSEQQRRCLLLRMEGLRYPEIASTLGISGSAVGEFLRRAMSRLKKVTE